ncbi:MAG: cysteine synthase family protein [Candidatus Rokubacteria bacterium]|nr:cysteine synthase family protein [Candidatus Rokubacteria bacterium]
MASPRPSPRPSRARRPAPPGAPLAGSVLDLIGRTPLVELRRLAPSPEIRLFAKLEGQNPTGSLKDRIALAMIEAGEASGVLTPDKTILEPTSGNTGISLALVGRLKGYRVTAVMPENVSLERQRLLAAFGAEVILTEGARGTNGAIEVAQRLAKDPRYFMPFQYGNPANPRAHYEGTARELLEALPEIGCFVAGLGTGGTLMGVGRRLKEAAPRTRVIAVEPEPGEQVQGLRSLEEGFVPPILDLALLDGKVLVKGLDALAATRLLLQREGIFAGLSSGAVLHAALREARRLRRGTVVALLADGGWKYLSAGFWTGPLAAAREELAAKLWW